MPQLKPQKFLSVLANPYYQSEFTDADSHAVLNELLAPDAFYKLQMNAEDLCFNCQSHAVEDAGHATKSAFTIAGQHITVRILAQVLHALVGSSDAIVIAKNRFSDNFAVLAIDVFLGDDTAISKEKIDSVSRQYRLDIYIKSKTSICRPGLLVMDMDSTVINMECIDEIAELAGVKDKVSAVTERAMRGEIAFTQSLHDRVACLRGVAQSDLLSIRQSLPLMPGFLHVMQILKEANWSLAIASGGFTFFADYVKQVAGLDEAHSNVLEIDNGLLTGKVKGRVVDAEEKARILVSLATQYKIPQAQTVAMGDGANDLMMMKEAACSIAYHAKPSVSAAANVAIKYGGFEGLLFTLSE
ncbi:phosphoserine phosphatase SerB [Glaciecola siphonariae]|uniref:Phosphoserine phosphatase n=1 Tax=Glaciecola siphonariae TaxID=521012 RepID=A0ABV9M128_9ALTE